MSTPTMDQLLDEMLRLSKKIDDALEFLYRQAREWADAEDAYRAAKARAYLQSSGTVQARQAHVDDVCQEQRHRAHLADAMRQAALEAVRSRRAQLSSCQSIANAVRAEIDMARTAPGVAA